MANLVIPTFDPIEHSYTLRGRPQYGVTQILSGLRLTPPYPEDRGQKEFGTAAHRAAELAVWDRLDFSTLSSVLLPYVEGFLEKTHELKIRPIKSEIIVWHEFEGYAGKLDLWAEVNGGEQAIIDFKSGTPPRCVELQTAGYGLALEACGIQQGWPVQLQPRPRRFSMQLLPGRAVVRECKDPYDYVAWLGAVRLFKWTSEHRKGL